MMHLLLPPSETKRSGGGSAFAPERLAHAAELGAARAHVRAALETLCADEDAAAAALKLGAKSRGELAHNRALATSGAMPAMDRYTGVLYDSLDAGSLGARERAWMAARVSIQSALFGLIAAGDEIPAYRLSAGSRLPDLGGPLKRVWRDAHRALPWAEFGWVLDLRSKDYVELAPLPPGTGDFLLVAQRGPEGRVRALNHFNKAAKGALVRRLAEAFGGADAASATPPIVDRAGFLDWARGAGLEVVPGPGEHELTLVTEAGA